MDRAEYNRNFGEMQDFVLRIGGADNFRVREQAPHPQGDGWRENICEVYWNDGWHEMGRERVGPDDLGSPLVGKTQRTYAWHEQAAATMMQRYVSGITSDRSYNGGAEMIHMVNTVDERHVPDPPDIVDLARDYLAHNAAESGADVLIKDLTDEVERLRRLIDGRDDFIVAKGLFEEFAGQLKP